MGSLDHLSGNYISQEPADRWAVIVDRDDQFVAVRRGHEAVITYGCCSPEIAEATDSLAVVEIVQEWIASHPNELAAERARQAANSAADENLRRETIATNEAIRIKIARHNANRHALGKQSDSRSDVAANVTTDEVRAVRDRMFGDVEQMQ